MFCGNTDSNIRINITQAGADDFQYKSTCDESPYLYLSKFNYKRKKDAWKPLWDRYQRNVQKYNKDSDIAKYTIEDFIYPLNGIYDKVLDSQSQLFMVAGFGC